MFKNLKHFSICILLIYCAIQNVNCEEENTNVADDANSNKEVIDEDVLASGLILQHETVVQSDQPSSGERFVAIHVDSQGNKEQLRTTLKGLSNMAINFLPSTYDYIDVVSATREVVAGVRYDLIVNALDENKSHTTCELIILEKPWIITQYGNKLKILEYSNCTATEDSTAATDNDDQQQIQYNTNPIFINQNTEMSETSMKDLEAQILTASSLPTIRPTTTIAATTPGDNKENFADQLDDKSKNILDQFFMYGTFGENNNNERVESTYVERLDTENVDVSRRILPETQTTIDDTVSEQTVPVEDISPTTTEATFEMNIQKTFDEVLKTHQDIQKALDDVIMHGGGRDTQKKYEPIFETLVTQMKAQIDNYYKKQDQDADHTNALNEDQPQTQITVTYVPEHLAIAEPTVDTQQQIISDVGITQDDVSNAAHADDQQIIRSKRSIAMSERQYHLELARKALAQLDNLDSDNYKRVVIKIDNITKMMKRKNDEGVEDKYYNMKVRIGISECTEDMIDSVDCNKKLMKNSTKLCLIEVRVRRDAVQVTESKCSPDNNNVIQRSKRVIPGGQAPLDESDARQYVNEALVRLKEVEGANNVDMEFVSIINATTQVVSGKMVRIHANIKSGESTIQCYFEIWDRPWLQNGRKVDIDCGEDSKQYTFRSKRSMPHSRHFSLEIPKGEERAQQLFDKFKLKHNRKYANNLEHDMRYRIFKNNLYTIEQLNRHEQGTAKYGVTEFADFTTAEYKKRTGLLKRAENSNEIKNPIAEIPDVELPAQFDWRDQGVVTEVKNQGSCGSCWAFSVVGNIEGLYAIKNKKLAEFSEQELLDCDTVDKACDGGLPDDAYKALEQIGGLEYESEYPYLAKKESECHFNQSMSHVSVSGAVDLPKNETAMQQWLVANGPISIGINANAMQFYRGGISHPWKILCRAGSIDHGVLIVGYGIKEYPMFNKTLPYWIVKNSWGPSWGEQGYYRVYRGENTCGISEMASSAVLA